MVVVGLLCGGTNRDLAVGGPIRAALACYYMCDDHANLIGDMLASEHRKNAKEHEGQAPGGPVAQAEGSEAKGGAQENVAATRSRGTAARGLLEQALREERLVAVSTNPDDPDVCSVGYIDALTSTHYRLRSVTSRGCVLGYELRRIEDVVEVALDGPYLRRVQALMNNPGAIADVEPPGTDDLVRDMVQAARDARRAVTVFRVGEHEGVTAHVTAVTDLRVTIQALDSFGDYEDTVPIPWRDISGIGTHEEQIRVLLHDKGSG